MSHRPTTASPPTSRTRLLAWLAAFAWLLAALAPAVSQALASQRGGPELAFAICSSTGSATRLALQNAASSTGDPSDSGSAHSAFEACAYCLLQHQQTLALTAPVAPVRWAAHTFRHERPRAHVPSATPSAAPWAPPARGPPTLAA
jgi:hypothetical protein